MITYHKQSAPVPKIQRRLLGQWIRTVAAKYGKKVGEVAYIFCSDEGILAVNREYLHHDYYTDIITFDYSEGEHISGDIFISIDTVRSNSKKFQTLYPNELHRVLIHGILHLCGLKDKGNGQRAKMEAAENEALAELAQMMER